jgi:hypothetical protein
MATQIPKDNPNSNSKAYVEVHVTDIAATQGYYGVPSGTFY